MKTTFGQRFRAALKARGISPTRFESEAKFSKGHVSRLLNGKGTKVESDTIAKIADHLKISYEWLANERGGMERDAVAPAPPSGPRPASPEAESPTPPPISDTYLIGDDRLDALMDTAFVSGRHSRADVRLVEACLSQHSTLLVDGVDPATYVRTLLDTAAKYRTKGRKVTPAELPQLTIGKLVGDVAEGEQRLVLFEESARAFARENGLEWRETPHPALLAAEEAIQKKLDRRGV